MSSPTAQAEQAGTSAPADGGEVNVDAEMEDVVRAEQTAPNSSSTPTQQTDTQPTTSNPNLLQQNRKDVSLREFLSKMDDYGPIIPDAVTAHYLTLAGLPPPSAVDPSGATTNTTPLPLARLLALATQKFVADVAADAYQYSRIRASNSTSANSALAGGGVPGQAVPGVAGVGGGVGGGAMGKGAQAAQLGVQRAGYGGGGQGGNAQGRTVLTMEDLGMAVQEYGINVKRGEFYR